MYNFNQPAKNALSNHYITLHSVSKQSLREAMYSYHNIPLEYQHCMEHYKKLYWSAAYLLEQMNLSIEPGTITRYNKSFVWVFSPDLTRGKLLQMCKENPFSQVCISFREAKAEFGLVSTAFISLS